MANLTLNGLEGDVTGLTIVAQFNPKEVSVDRAVNWRQQSRHGAADLEYTGSQPQTMSFELLFDGFESGQPVQPSIQILHRFCEPDPTLKRPPKLRVAWSSSPDAIPALDVVIEALSVRYLMIDPNGTVLRASATLKLKEAERLRVSQPGS